MKKVAGKLRLEMAQYRELAAFAQFGSDLDKATLAQLRRGERLVEILKQPQYAPVPLEDQVMIIYAGTNRYLDEIPMNQIREFQTQFLSYMRDVQPEIGKEIAETKLLSPENEERLKKAIDTFKKTFKA
jgi:F-type H+-transporting ATPase subunit alpha